MQDLIPPRQNPSPAAPAYGELWDDAPELVFAPVPPRQPWRVAALASFGFLLAVGCAVGGVDVFRALNQPPTPDPVAQAAAAALTAAKTQHQEIAALRVHVEDLKGKLDAQAQKSRASDATIATLQKSLAEAKTAAATSAAQLQSRLEKVQSDAEKAQKNIDRTPVGSIPKPLPRPAQMPAQAQVAHLAPAPRGLEPRAMEPRAMEPPALAYAPDSPPPFPRVGFAPYRDYVLRDVGGGHAVIEGQGRLEEIEPGDILPGGALVEKIERRGQNWVVRTSRGYISPEYIDD